MTLATLKTKLIVLTGTSIGEVLFDWQEYLSEQRAKTYPVVLWSLTGAKWAEDYRSTTINKTKILTINMAAVQSFEALTEDKITVWDTLEAKVKTYLNAMNATAGIQIMNIDQIKGEYVGEGLLSVDSEVGIWYTGIEIKMFC